MSTQLALQDVSGPLKDLLNKMTGREGPLWNRRLKRMLRGMNPFEPVDLGRYVYVALEGSHPELKRSLMYEVNFVDDQVESRLPKLLDDQKDAEQGLLGRVHRLAVVSGEWLVTHKGPLVSEDELLEGADTFGLTKVPLPIALKAIAKGNLPPETHLHIAPMKGYLPLTFIFHQPNLCEIVSFAPGSESDQHVGNRVQHAFLAPE